VYCCSVQKNLNITSPQINTKIIPSGAHANGKSDKSVDCIYADNKGIQYLPSGLEIVFGDLKAIWIRNGRIRNISQTDLKPFSKLINLDLSNNDIEALNDGLFDYNLNLEVILFFGNKIFYIGSTVFNKITKLSYLNLENINCTNKKADTIEAVKLFIKEIKITCYSSVPTVFKDFEALRNEIESSQLMLSDSMTKSQRTFDKKIGYISQDIEDLGKEIKSSNMQSNEIENTKKFRSMMMFLMGFTGFIQTIILIIIYTKFFS